jgi:hypothetical protein
MVRLQLDERQWQKVKAALGVRKGAGRPGRDDRNFVEAVLWYAAGAKGGPRSTASVVLVVA